MNCKNCQHPLPDDANFCVECGAKVVRERITLKRLLVDLASNAFVWDNKYFVTVWTLYVRPGKVLRDYIGGVRKRYVAPFPFVAIGAAISLLIFNWFAEDYLSLMEEIAKQQVEVMESMAENLVEADSIGATLDSSNVGIVTDSLQAGITDDSLSTEGLDMQVSSEHPLGADFEQQQLATMQIVQSNILKYYNWFMFALLPVYTLMARLTFGKRTNFAEQLIINAYIQGAVFIPTIILFVIALRVYQPAFFLSNVVLALYYTITYSRYYKLGVGKAILYLLKFVLVLIISAIAFFIICVLIGIGAAAVMQITG